MTDLRTLKTVENSFEIELVASQNQSLRKSNTILFGTIVVGLILMGYYIISRGRKESDDLRKIKTTDAVYF